MASDDDNRQLMVILASKDYTLGPREYQKFNGGGVFNSMVDRILAVERKNVAKVLEEYGEIVHGRYVKFTEMLLELAEKEGIILDMGGKILHGPLYSGIIDRRGPDINLVAGRFNFNKDILPENSRSILVSFEQEHERVTKRVNDLKLLYCTMVLHYRNKNHMFSICPDASRLLARLKESGDPWWGMRYTFNIELVSSKIKEKLKPLSSWALEGWDVDIFNKMLVEFNIAESAKE